MLPKKLVDLEVHAVAGVDKAANKRKFLVVKRANDAPTLRERLARLFKADEGDEPKTFDQAFALSNMEDQWWRLNDALRTSIRSIIESDAEDKAALIRESVGQYAEAIVALATRMGQAVGGESMQKMHEALTKLADACESDSEPWNRALKRVEECAKDWREQLEKGESNMPEKSTKNVDLDALLKGVSDEVKSAVKAAFTKQEEELANLRKQVEELSKGDDEGKPDDINKADLPEPVRKRLEELEKQAKEAEEIAKAEREARVRAEIRKRAEGYANVGEVDKIAEAIYKAQSVSAEFAEQLETLFKSAHERIEKGDLFKELGSGAGDSASTAWGKIEAAAAEIMKATPSMTRPQAIAKALEANPELEKAYYEEVRR